MRRIHRTVADLQESGRSGSMIGNWYWVWGYNGETSKRFHLGMSLGVGMIAVIYAELVWILEDGVYRAHVVLVIAL